jgi:hypothetical protein
MPTSGGAPLVAFTLRLSVCLNPEKQAPPAERAVRSFVREKGLPGKGGHT